MMLAKSTPVNPSKTSSLATSIHPQLCNGGTRRAHQVELRRRRPTVQAVLSRDGKSVSPLPSQSVAPGGPQRPPSPAEAIDVRVVLTVRNKLKEKLVDKIENRWEYFINGIGQGIVVQLVSEEIDPATKSGKRSAEAAVRGWLPKPSNHPSIFEYAANLTVQPGFGRPGAIIITNRQNKEFYLMEIVVHSGADGTILFPANSWIHSCNVNPQSRVIFSNRAYLPLQTPAGLKDLRQDVLVSRCGNGKGERKKFDVIYDYAPYNDLGNPDKDVDLARPVLGGEERPYPRRCRTGRPPMKSDPGAESRVEKPHPVYVPRDETFEEVKQSTFSSGALKALFHNLIPALRAALSSSDTHFGCFSDIDRLYKDGVLLKHEVHEITEGLMLPSMLKGLVNMGERLMKYDLPSIISRDRFSWLRDNEFARQTLAGVNPVDIQRLREFPILSKLDPAVYGSPESAITKECLEHELNGMSLEEAIENHRLFMLDYHDLLLPYVKKINSLKGRKTYASRTIFFHTRNGILRPIAIELSLPPTPSSPSWKRVYTHGHDATTSWIWKLAKAHVCANDAGVHQLVNHWGMAVEDPSMPCGVKLVLEDYPYAADSLLVWSAIEEWVRDYVTHFYADANNVASDVELQAWWDEIKNKGHPDKRNEPWWPSLNTKEDLINILTTMIWTASGQHAAINFGQYPFGGYMPNRPTLMKKLIPQEDEPEYENFLLNPQHTFLSSVPSQLQATQIMAVQDTLSTHSPDEEYLGQLHESHAHWIDDWHILNSYEKFSARLEEIEQIINKRNKNFHLKNRSGAGVPPYELLLPSSGPGVTGRGIPNSISI
uniref:Lipoxygenase 6, chloroplastic isoform X2 n=1 Tax=Elaeis guineensis var. tenera TaxID=51953 RepID=A0A6J0PMW6_ELAGV|nr:lipoxygenase 6, chloroplastic isoform X2 [Elaeis guineensis]